MSTSQARLSAQTTSVPTVAFYPTSTATTNQISEFHLKFPQFVFCSLCWDTFHYVVLRNVGIIVRFLFLKHRIVLKLCQRKINFKNKFLNKVLLGFTQNVQCIKLICNRINVSNFPDITIIPSVHISIWKLLAKV